VIKWSFSGLKDFINCPRQYHEVKILQRFAKETSQQMQYGTDVHKALEDYARDGTELPEFYKKFKPLVDGLINIPGTKYLEYKMALTEDKKPCDFNAPEYWVRGIVDFMVIDADTAYIVDYKTGNDKYADMKQLKLMSLMTFAHHPEVNTVKAGLLFLSKNNFLPDYYTRGDQDKLWGAFSMDLARLKMAAEHNVWAANPTALCGWCPVKTCEFHGHGRRR